MKKFLAVIFLFPLLLNCGGKISKDNNEIFLKGTVLTINEENITNTIENAEIIVKDIKGNVIMKQKSDSSGEFVVKYTNYDLIDISVNVNGYMPVNKRASFKLPQKLIILVEKAITIKINKGGVGKIVDNKKFELTVPADILSRIDNKPVNFPVTIRANYISNLQNMPCFDMLGVDSEANTINPLETYGAVNIDAVDSEGVGIRLDVKKSKAINKNTELRIKMSKPIDDVSKIKLWEIDKAKGDLTWRKINDKAKIDKVEKIGNDMFVIVRNVDFLPYNLDIPYPASPIKFIFIPDKNDKNSSWIIIISFVNEKIRYRIFYNLFLSDKTEKSFVVPKIGNEKIQLEIHTYEDITGILRSENRKKIIRIYNVPNPENITYDSQARIFRILTNDLKSDFPLIDTINLPNSSTLRGVMRATRIYNDNQ